MAAGRPPSLAFYAALNSMRAMSRSGTMTASPPVKAIGEKSSPSRGTGYLPAPHRMTDPIRLGSADIPLGTGLSDFVGWFRDLIWCTEERDGDWRDVIDGLRPFNQQIWQSWSADPQAWRPAGSFRIQVTVRIALGGPFGPASYPSLWCNQPRFIAPFSRAP
ncbi:hypothetical protein KEU06_26000 [Pseudaminobacter sp. 19-2017]|uniref:Uncharacterized protein n=1 Tax=Pseudaminobacter soli (ex Zhang et al. 2022) TaxID=2831468 RepID=A0A942E1I7_9HYPH|nr:hypothetical protein [Pseudaminobacter soli]